MEDAKVLNLPIEIQFLIIDLAGIDSAVSLCSTCKHLQVLTAKRITVTFLSKPGRDHWQLWPTYWENKGTFFALMKTIEMACLHNNEDEWVLMRDKLKRTIVDFKGAPKARRCMSNVHSKVLAVLIHLLFETYCISDDTHARMRLLVVLEAIIEKHALSGMAESKRNEWNGQRQACTWSREPDRLDNIWLSLVCTARDNRRVIQFCLDERQYVWRKRVSSNQDRSICS